MLIEDLTFDKKAETIKAKVSWQHEGTETYYDLEGTFLDKSKKGKKKSAPNSSRLVQVPKALGHGKKKLNIQFTISEAGEGDKNNGRVFEGKINHLRTKIKGKWHSTDNEQEKFHFEAKLAEKV